MWIFRECCKGKEERGPSLKSERKEDEKSSEKKERESARRREQGLVRCVCVCVCMYVYVFVCVPSGADKFRLENKRPTASALLSSRPLSELNGTQSDAESAVVTAAYLLWRWRC